MQKREKRKQERKREKSKKKLLLLFLFGNHKFCLQTFRVMINLFPFYAFSLKIDNFDDVVYHLNRTIWIAQIFISLAYCLVVKRFLPYNRSTPPRRTRYEFLLKQVNVYFLTACFVYAMEMCFSTVLYTMFERFLHHTCAICIMIATLFEQNILCFHYLFPLFLHALYWTLTRSSLLSQNNVYNLLVVYSSLLLVYAFILLWRFYWKLKVISVRIPLCATFLFNINIMSHFYGYFVNLYSINYGSMVRAIFISLSLSSPVYIFIFYTFYVTKCKRNKKHVSFV